MNYNYYYSLNAWLLVCPWWLCFDWSMGCVPLIKSAVDWRAVWVLLLWCILLGLLNQALCSQDIHKRRYVAKAVLHFDQNMFIDLLPLCLLYSQLVASLMTVFGHVLKLYRMNLI